MVWTCRSATPSRRNSSCSQSCSIQCFEVVVPRQQPTTCFGSLCIVVAYAPTNDASDADENKFYESLEQAMQLTNCNDLVLCLGRKRGLARNPPTVVGPHGSGTDNDIDNSRRLLDFCISANLRICGSWFRRNNIYRFSWLSNDNKTAKEIDHVLVNRRWNVIMNYRVYRKP